MSHSQYFACSWHLKYSRFIGYDLQSAIHGLAAEISVLEAPGHRGVYNWVYLSSKLRCHVRPGRSSGLAQGNGDSLAPLPLSLGTQTGRWALLYMRGSLVLRWCAMLWIGHQLSVCVLCCDCVLSSLSRLSFVRFWSLQQITNVHLSSSMMYTSEPCMELGQTSVARN